MAWLYPPLPLGGPSSCEPGVNLTGLVPDVGERRMVELLTNASTGSENLVLRLFKSNTTPTSTMTLTDYTEATFTGYASETLSSAGWTICDNPTGALYASNVPFTCSGTTSEQIYGFYLTQAGSSTLMWSERFDSAPYPITYSGDSLAPRPKIVVGATSG